MINRLILDQLMVVRCTAKLSTFLPPRHGLQIRTRLAAIVFCLMAIVGAAQAQNEQPAQSAPAMTDEMKQAFETLRRSNAFPFPLPMMMQPPEMQKWEPNTVTEPFPKEARDAMMTSMSGSNPWSLRQVFNFMTLKMKAAEGLSFDEVVEAMESRAVEENLKGIGRNQVWKEVEAKTGESTPKFEILQYCDALVARMVLDYSPEFSIFLPCRISVVEDAKGDIWLMTLDWDVSWLSFTWHPDSQLDEELKENGRRIRNAMVSIMEAGASGDW